MSLALGLATALAVLAPAPAQALTFSLVDLGIAPGWEARQPTTGYGLNARGDVIGQIGTSQSTQTALWTAPVQDGSRRSAVYVPPVANE